MIESSPRIVAALALAVALVTPALTVAGAVDAKALVKEHCSSCHGSEVYTRENRRVGSLEALHTQVRMCEQNLGLTWFDDQIDAVTNLLNAQFYKFDR
jgi:mono/diheme cytochrome c family protein